MGGVGGAGTGSAAGARIGEGVRIIGVGGVGGAAVGVEDLK